MRGRHLLMNPGVIKRTQPYESRGGLHTEQARQHGNLNNVPGLNKHGNHVHGGWIDAPAAEDGKRKVGVGVKGASWWVSEESCAERVNILKNIKYDEEKDMYDASKKRCADATVYLKDYLRAQLGKPRAEIRPPALKMWLDDQDGIPKSINKGLCHLYKEDPVLKEVREDSFRISKGRPIKGNGNTGEVHWMGRKHVAGVPTGEKVGAIIVFVEDESHAHCFNVD